MKEDGRMPALDLALDHALGDGRWPPLHALWLASALVLGIDPRLLGVLLGAASTGLVFALTRRWVGPRAARVAALLHALLPAFLFYSHSLWSEPLALTLALASLLAAADCRRRLGAGAPFIMFALSAGVALGLLALTRVALAPWSFVVPVWLAWTPAADRRRRFQAAALCLGTSLLLLAPWVWLQAERFGQVGLSTLSGYNLALGNHGSVPPGYGSSWGHRESSQRLHEELRERAAASGSSGAVPGAWAAEATDLAVEEISQRPMAALWRVPVRLWLLIAPDAFPVRHLLHGVYPSLPPPLTAILIAAIVLAHLATLALGVAGLWVVRFQPGTGARPLLVALIAITAAAPALTVSTTRLHLPIELLLLPAAAALLAGASERRWRSAAIALGAAVACLSAAALPRVAELYWQPAAVRAAPWLGEALGPLGVEIVYSDRYRLVAAHDGPNPFIGAELTVRLGPPRSTPELEASFAPRSWLGEEHGVTERRIPRAGEIDVFQASEATLELIDGNGEIQASWTLPIQEDAAEVRGAFRLEWIGGGVSPR